MTIKKPLVRIVDDDPDVLKAMRKVLELEGYQVVTYPSGEAFLTEDSYSLPGCVILDLKMPGLNLTTLLFFLLLTEKWNQLFSL